MNSAAAGDVICVHAGTYAEALTISKSGTASSPITLQAYPGETPVIDGQNRLPGGGQYGTLVEVRGNYVTIDGFEFKNSTGEGIHLFGTHDTVRNSTIHHMYDVGIIGSGDYSIIEYNNVYENGQVNANGRCDVQPYGNLCYWPNGIGVARDEVDGITNNAIIRNNISHDNWGEGIDSFESNGTLIENNISYNNFSVNLYVSDSPNTTVRNNLVYNINSTHVRSGNPASLTIADEVAGKPRSSNVQVTNNIISGTDICEVYWTIPTGLSNINVNHNTLVNGTVDMDASNGTNITQSNNCTITPAQVSGLGSPAAGSLTAAKFTTATCPAGTGANVSAFSSAVGPNTGGGTTPAPAPTPNPTPTPTPTPVPPAPAPTVTLTASPTNITPGQSSTLTWGSTNSTACLATSGFSTAGTPQGSSVVTPTVTTTYSVVCVGAGGSASASATITLPVATPDTQAPTTPAGLTATPVSWGAIDLIWGASTDNVGVVGYRIYQNGVLISTTANRSYQSTGLLPNTAYTYRIAAFDAAGNVSEYSTSVSATTLPLTQVGPTIPAGLTAVAVSPTQVNLTWTASTDADAAVVGYRVYRNVTLIATTTGTSYSDGNLTPSTSYGYRVEAYDTAKNVSELTPRAVVVTPGLNTGNAAGAPPTTPTNIVATPISPYEVTLSWTAATGTGGIAGYDIYVDDVVIGKSTTNSYTVTGLSPAITHTYAVVAHDAQGQLSLRSNTTSAMTQSGRNTSGIGSPETERAANDPGEVASPLIQNDIVCFLLGVLNAVARVLSPVVVLMVVYTGFLFATAQGNEAKIMAAKSALAWTIVGVVVVLGSIALTMGIKAIVSRYSDEPGAAVTC
jgi:chitodextrinase